MLKIIMQKLDVENLLNVPGKFMKHYSGLAVSAKNIVMRPITVPKKTESHEGREGMSQLTGICLPNRNSVY